MDVLREVKRTGNELDDACAYIPFWHAALCFWLTRESVYGPNVVNAVEMIEFSRAAVIRVVQRRSN